MLKKITLGATALMGTVTMALADSAAKIQEIIDGVDSASQIWDTVSGIVIGGVVVVVGIALLKKLKII